MALGGFLFKNYFSRYITFDLYFVSHQVSIIISHMKIPWSDRKKALIVVDVQPGFMNKRNSYIIGPIKKLIKETKYDFYVESIFHAEKGCIWDVQTRWTLPKDGNFKTVDELLPLLTSRSALHLEKETKSAFKGKPDLHAELKKQGIQELHLVGVDTNDCVLATAFEGFDFGYFTYVIEECTESSSSEKMNEVGLQVLQHLNLTNNTCVEKVKFWEV